MKPIEITIYDPETNEPKKTYTRSFIPWAILKKAIRMQKLVNTSDIDETTVDEMAALVVAAFGDQFSLDEVTNGADVGEMMTVIQSIIARASQFVQGNPPTPAA